MSAFVKYPLKLSIKCIMIFVGITGCVGNYRTTKVTPMGESQHVIAGEYNLGASGSYFYKRGLANKTEFISRFDLAATPRFGLGLKYQPIKYLAFETMGFAMMTQAKGALLNYEVSIITGNEKFYTGFKYQHLEWLAKYYWFTGYEFKVFDKFYLIPEINFGYFDETILTLPDDDEPQRKMIFAPLSIGVGFRF